MVLLMLWTGCSQHFSLQVDCKLSSSASYHVRILIVTPVKWSSCFLWYCSSLVEQFYTVWCVLSWYMTPCILSYMAFNTVRMTWYVYVWNVLSLGVVYSLGVSFKLVWCITLMCVLLSCLVNCLHVCIQWTWSAVADCYIVVSCGSVFVIQLTLLFVRVCVYKYDILS